MKKLALAVALAGTLTLAGCASTGGNEAAGRLAIQYATLKVIEQSDTVDAADVVAHVDRLRAHLDGEDEVALVDLRQELLSRIDMEGLDAADRLLVMTLLDQVEMALALDEESGLLDDEAKARIVEVLDWVVTAARMASPPAP